MKDKLIELGLTEREADAYLALYSYEEATASQLSKVTKEHRTNIYDSLDGLIKKGLIVYYIKNNVKYYKIADPQKLIDYTKDKEKIAENLVNDFKQKINKIKEEPIVEVYEGNEGLKSLLWKIIREGKTLYGIGASEEWEKRVPFQLLDYMKERKKINLKAKLLYVKGTKPITNKLNEVKFLPTEFNQPSTVAIFGDYVTILIWTNPLIATLIKSKDLSNSFKNYFEVLWKLSS